MAEAATTVSALIAQQTAAVDEISQQADTFLQDLLDITNVQFSNGFNIDNLLPTSYGYAPTPIVGFSIATAAPPDVSIPDVAPPEAPASTFSMVTDIAVPDLAAVAPVLAFPSPPSAALPASPAAAPEFVMPDIPGAPVINLPAVPTFASLVLPDAPSITIPAFTTPVPIENLVAPTAEFAYFEREYASVLLSPLKAKLLSDLVNGGYGIDVTDEAALYERARDREVLTSLTRVDEAGRAMAARGFPLPPGDLAIAYDRAQQELQDKMSSVSREIFVDSAKRFVDNRQFTIQQAREVEQVLIGFHNAVQERALNVSRLTVEMAIAVYNTTRDKFLAQIEVYKAEAAAFADRIRGELAKAEVYRTLVEGKRLEVEVQKSQVDTYVAQLRGIQTSADIYRIQMDAAAVRAGIERTKLEAYRAQVETFTAQVQAKVAEFGMYRAQIEGQTARVNIYEAEVRAFSSQVAAAKTKSDVQLGKLQAEVEQARIKQATYASQITAYDSNIRRQVESRKLGVDVFRGNVELARATTDGLAKNAELQLGAINQAVTQNTQISQVAIENAKARLLATVEELKFRTGATQYASEKYYALLTNMVSTINTLAVQTATG